MGRGGQKKERDGPERRCIATGKTGGTAGMIRFVLGPDGAQVVPDLAGKLPGRGVWVTSERGALETAVSKRLFSRGFKATAEVPEDLTARIEDGLVRRVVELISLARKAGQAVAGYEKVRGWLDTGEAVALLQAADGSPRGKSKLRPPPGEGRYIGTLAGSELGLAFGREHVIHGALAAGGLTNRVVEEAARLSGLRGTDGGKISAGKDDETL